MNARMCMVRSSSPLGMTTMTHSLSSSAQRFREALTLTLIFLLPFHALLVTVATRLVAGPGYAPLSWLALWKEGVLAFIFGVAILEILFAILGKTRNSKLVTRNSSIDLLDILILSLLALSLLVTAFTHANWGLYLFGFRYDFVPLVAFLLLRRVAWSEGFLRQAITVLLWSGGIVAVYGILTFFVPSEFFTWLGYSDLHSLYVADRPIAAFQQIGGTDLRRIQGPTSGPNHLGLWLLLPLGMVLVHLINNPRSFRPYLFSLVLGIALVLTFSRASWIAAAVMGLLALYPVARHMKRSVLVGLGCSAVCAVAILVFLFPSVIVRVSSSRGHLHNPIEALQRMVDHPLGQGLGMAGPASNRVSDTCVLLLEGDNPSWWVQNRPDMCVFVGDAQVLPTTGKECTCPFLPENWFLQIGVEMGWVGLVLYVMLVGVVLYRLKRVTGYGLRVTSEYEHSQLVTRSLLYSFLAVCIAGLFLHAFEDAAVAYTLWVLAAVVMQKTSKIN